MTRLQALTELLNKLDGENLVDENMIVDQKTSEQIDLAFNVSDLHGDVWASVMNAADGYIDAAREVHNAMLPEWEWSIDKSYAHVWQINPTRKGYSAMDDCPARAWVMAIIKALIAQETDT